MTHHRVKRNEFRLGNGSIVNIEYWIDRTAVHVAAFGPDGHQISLAEYQASVGNADELDTKTQAALIDSLANELEYALINNPEVHIRKH